ncbi:MAG: hypothetical protein JWO06_1874 [Bacteroidota bacterium]|nr:hypothetical protein [Bacteroidota bacterium]
MNQPADTLPNILKLLDSNSDKVVAYLIQRLKEMIESFFDSVYKEMEAAYVHKIFKNNTAIKKVKSYHEEFIKHIEQKEALNELNAWQNEHTLVRYYTELYQRKQNRVIGDAMNKGSSFLQHSNSVTLAKSGGWKMEGRDEITQLNNISSSSLFPRTYFIKPEYFNQSVTSKYLVNWAQIFKWEQIQL